ncbi:MAG TPA: hypothetical protein VIK47_02095, partial [Kiloniellales bacterium]
DGKALLLKPVLDELGEPPVILDHQKPHSDPRFRRRRSGSLRRTHKAMRGRRLCTRKFGPQG